ncbi:MAG: HAMP domain-containing sensor histidine kinase [Melioribacteraceae bacterium]
MSKHIIPRIDDFAIDPKILTELNEFKFRFMSIASHEFRTPLTTILTSSELLLMVGRSISEDKYEDYIIQIQNSVIYMTSILDDILTLNKIETGKWKFNPTKTNLTAFCNKMIEDANNFTSDKHKLIFKSNFKNIFAIIDNKLLQHIISNLLSNSIKYSPRGGDIILRLDKSKSDLIFSVADNGIGVMKKDQEKLFEIFYRGKNAEKYEGTGLGLSIVKRCVDSHGGKINFESKLNKGTKFEVTIPMFTSI